MDFTRTFKIVQDNNGNFGFRIPPSDRASYNAMLNKCKEVRKGWATIKITLPRKYKSKGQNGLFHDNIGQIALETGNEFGTVKEYCKSNAVSMGYPQKLNKDGDKMSDLYGNPIGKSFADVTTMEASIAMDAVNILAADFGIILNKGQQ